MNWLDIILIIALAAATIAGFSVGLIRGALALIGVVAGLFLAGRLYTPLASVFPFITNSTAAMVIAFILILLVVMVIAHFIAKLLKWLTSMTPVGWLDHLLGGAFGLISGVIFVGAAVATWIVFFGINGAIQDSKVSGILLGYLPPVLGLLPSDFNAVRSFFR